VDLGVEPRQPSRLSTGEQLALGALGEGEVVPAVALMCQWRVLVGVEPLAGVLAHGFEHQQAGVCV
jgi:hypothetical protein